MAKRPTKGEFEVGEADASPAALAKAKRLAKECTAAQARVDILLAEEGLLKSRINHLKTIAIPDAMSQAGIDSFGIGDQVVVIEDFVAGTIPKEPEKRKAALDLMSEYGFGNSIRTLITIDFAKEDHEAAVKLYSELRKNNSLNITMKEDIHNQTYLAHIRELLDDGKKLDADKLGVFIGNTTKFKKVKDKKGKVK